MTAFVSSAADEKFDELGPLRDIMYPSKAKPEFVRPAKALPRMEPNVDPMQSGYEGAPIPIVAASLSPADRKASPRLAAKAAKLDENFGPPVFEEPMSRPEDAPMPIVAASQSSAERQVSPRSAAKISKAEKNFEPHFFGSGSMSSKTSVPVSGYRKCKRNKNLPQSPCMPAFLVIGAQKGGGRTPGATEFASVDLSAFVQVPQPLLI